jgi:hypothetical protein
MYPTPEPGPESRRPKAIPRDTRYDYWWRTAQTGVLESCTFAHLGREPEASLSQLVEQGYAAEGRYGACGELMHSSLAPTHHMRLYHST